MAAYFFCIKTPQFLNSSNPQFQKKYYLCKTLFEKRSYI